MHGIEQGDTCSLDSGDMPVPLHTYILYHRQAVKHCQAGNLLPTIQVIDDLLFA